jgi:glycosyltransferase involved in cell wall biosynthesis
MLSGIRKVLATAKVPIQLIIVLDNKNLEQCVTTLNLNEIIVSSPRKGRGFAFKKGISHATGDIILLLHSDTIPPIGWSQAILKVMKDPNVVGGGFSLTYDIPSPLLNLGIQIINLWFQISKEIYGDRAMFVRSSILHNCLSSMEVPLLEDVRLAKCMRQHGKVVMLKEEVTTSAKALQVQGLLNYIGKFIRCRIWYTLGGDPQTIYQVYYSR